jgi:hypothetical protein
MTFSRGLDMMKVQPLSLAMLKAVFNNKCAMHHLPHALLPTK